MRKTSIALGIAAALTAHTGLTADMQAIPEQSISSTIANAVYGEEPPPDNIVLFGQGEATAFGAQVLRDSDNPAFDSEAADDFTVNNSAGWIVNSLLMQVYFNNYDQLQLPSPASFDVSIRMDDDGMPGDEVCGYAEASGEYNALNIGFGFAQFALPTPCLLGRGTYWLSITPVFHFNDLHSQSFWAMGLGPARGMPGVWRNPGGGYGTPCSDFQVLNNCTGAITSPIGAGFSNFGFIIFGTKVPPPCSDVIFADGFEVDPAVCTP